MQGETDQSGASRRAVQRSVVKSGSIELALAIGGKLQKMKIKRREILINGDSERTERLEGMIVMVY